MASTASSCVSSTLPTAVRASQCAAPCAGVQLCRPERTRFPSWNRCSRGHADRPRSCGPRTRAPAGNGAVRRFERAVRWAGVFLGAATTRGFRCLNARHSAADSGLARAVPSEVKYFKCVALLCPTPSRPSSTHRLHTITLAAFALFALGSRACNDLIRCCSKMQPLRGPPGSCTKVQRIRTRANTTPLLLPQGGLTENLVAGDSQSAHCNLTKHRMLSLLRGYMYMGTVSQQCVPCMYPVWNARQLHCKQQQCCSTRSVYKPFSPPNAAPRRFGKTLFAFAIGPMLFIAPTQS